MVSSHRQATRGGRIFCFAKTMEKVPSLRAQPRFTKVRDIQKLRYSSPQIGFSAGYQHRAGVKVARRGRCRRDFPGKSIAQWFSRLQSVRDAFLRLALAAQADEGFALEIQDVLLGHELRRGDGAASENVCQFAADGAVVFRGIPAANHHMDGELRAGKKFFT